MLGASDERAGGWISSSVGGGRRRKPLSPLSLPGRERMELLLPTLFIQLRTCSKVMGAVIHVMQRPI